MTSPAAVDLEAYFARICYRGPISVGVETLHGLAAAHTAALPFNNVDILLGRPVPLDIASLQQKLVVEGRGGYCFEQNGLMCHVLRQLGFKVRPMGGRVRMDQPRHAVPPRTHMVLAVEADGEHWLVDVGFGRYSLTCALRLDLGTEQATPIEPRRLVREEGRIFHQARSGGDWRDVYEFTLDELHPIDQEIANWWTSTSPASRFRNHLTAARVVPPRGRVTINDRQFSMFDADGNASRREIASSSELLELLEKHFGLAHPPGTQIDIPAAPWPPKLVRR